MNNIIETVNSAILYNMKEPLIITAIIFAVITALTIFLVIHEVKKNKNDTE